MKRFYAFFAIITSAILIPFAFPISESRSADQEMRSHSLQQGVDASQFQESSQRTKDDDGKSKHYLFRN
jgi:hypothetical protein